MTKGSEIKVAIADPSLLIREGLKSIIEEGANAKISKEYETLDELKKGFKRAVPDLLIIDYQAIGVDDNYIRDLLAAHPELKIMCLTNEVSSVKLELIIRTGIDAHIFKDCDREEIIDAVVQTNRGDKFFCGKVLEALTELEKGNKTDYSCKGLNISQREGEVIKLVAEGFTNKEIAEKLFLSPHTILTHRKRIMAKLGIGNTAGLVMYAIRENLIRAE